MIAELHFNDAAEEAEMCPLHCQYLEDPFVLIGWFVEAEEVEEQIEAGKEALEAYIGKDNHKQSF